ncbi:MULTISPECIES: thioredoxin domain-containing protein [Rathayibacter]|jgi:protein-disulfide isomerase|uniref:Thioredoxin domain-containing protein n=1 Tax=Rathayibacter festucae TaxID=110937 RepID=A0ABX6H1P7_9MICO|nr:MULTISPECIES: thioredoxin domain-containing protein [Rathayibacter]MCJ1672568.1 DsbA family protein [Rathayibacter sp. VKM Ac-2929]MCJ1682046.1 DsbA family protein [Rathayibacter sp. VKM Ac-2928]MCJ1686009.1 DsbA family protein [Rathayibacter sp. VKM Ac-2927]MCJ1699304.1 DsbA family protein [Rathayibacter festucae]QHC63715.1 thioredoxin domain-containing protein [Rathayibacter festucae]
MTIGGANDRLSKNQRREAAREKARRLREQQKRRDRVSRFALQGGLAIVVIAIVAVVVFAVTSSIRPAGPGPANMASDGVLVTEGLVASTTPAIPADGTPTPSVLDTSTGTVDIRVYLDYLCPYCGQFEQTNGDQIKEWVTSGAATVEIHPIAILTTRSNGTKYSERAANAAACVADRSPDSFFDFNAALFAEQPAEGTDGLSDDQLKQAAADAGVEDTAAVNSCIDDQSFVSWVRAATERATSGPLPGTEVASVSGTPTVLVNGEAYTGSLTDADAFSSFVLSAAADTYSSATPTPTPAAG